MPVFLICKPSHLDFGCAAYCTLLHTYIANANAHIWKYNLQYMHTHVHIQKYANMQNWSCICNQSIGCGQIIQKSILWKPADYIWKQSYRTANFYHHRIILSSQPGEETLLVVISTKGRFSNQGRPLLILPSASLGKTQFSEIPLNIWRDEDLTVRQLSVQFCIGPKTGAAILVEVQY